jgi:hypothetical protein
MSEYLIIDPSRLYSIYSADSIKEYYEYNFLPEFTSIDIDIFYDILNSLTIKQISNLHSFLYKQWNLNKLNSELLKIKPTSRSEHILLKQLSPTIQSNQEFNDTLSEFISNDHILGLYIMNNILIFLYPT